MEGRGWRMEYPGRDQTGDVHRWCPPSSLLSLFPFLFHTHTHTHNQSIHSHSHAPSLSLPPLQVLQWMSVNAANPLTIITQDMARAFLSGKGFPKGSLRQGFGEVGQNGPCMVHV